MDDDDDDDDDDGVDDDDDDDDDDLLSQFVVKFLFTLEIPLESQAKHMLVIKKR